MKKLSQSLKNKQMTLSQLLVVITVLIVTASTIGYSGNYSVYENIFKIFNNYDPYMYGEMFIFGDEYFLLQIFGANLPQIVILLFISFLCSFTSFKFLHRKSLALTTLSFPVSRSTMFRKKVIIPLVIITLTVIINKSVALYLNAEYWGFTSNLFGVFIANTLITLQYVLVGFVAGIFGRLFAGRIFEGVLTSASIMFLPKAIYFLISCTSSFFLHGYTSIVYGANETALFLDPLKHILSLSEVYNNVATNLPIPYHSIFAALFWNVILVLSLIALRYYFIKNTKFETVGFMGRRKIINLLNALTIPTLIASIILEEWYGIDLLTYGKWITVTMSIAAVVVAALIINSIFTRKVRFNKERVIIASVGALSFLFASVIAITGGLGYEKRIPEIDDIETMNISFSFDIIEYVDNAYDNPESVVSSNRGSAFERYGVSSGYTNISFSDRKDLAKALGLHRILTTDKTNETAEMITVLYLLKNGSTMERTYYYIPFDACDYSLSLWETDTVKNWYKDILLHSNENIYHEDELLMHFNYDKHKIALSDGAKIYTIAKDSTLKELSELTPTEFLTLKTAIYNDIYSLTWEEWFKPVTTYGFLAFKNSHEQKQIINGVLEDWGTESFMLKIPVTSEMTQTIRVLKELNCFESFKTTKTITKAYVLDSEDACKTLALQNSFTNETLNFYHSVFFNSALQYSRINITSLSNKIEGSKSLIPLAKEISGKEAEELFNKSHQRYYCRDDSELFLVCFNDSTTEEYIIPKD